MKIRQKAKTLRNRALATTLAIVLLLMISPQAPPAYAAELPGDAPVGVDGRILTPDKTGDICNWVEIAQYGEYSLIVRSEFLNLQSYHYGEPIWQTARWQIPRDGNSNVGYTRDNVSHCINCWFNFFEVKVSDDGLNTFYDVLPEHARLREFTMQHNALGTLGTRYTSTTLTDGLSRPTNYQVGVGDNIAFCLSYSEAANFLSLTRNFPGANEITYLSPPEAVANFHKVNIPTTPEVYYFGMWLRTPGNNAMTESALLDYGYVHELDVLNTPTNTGHAFGYGLIYPALWVNSDIFDEKGTVNIQHLDAKTGETLSPSESHVVKAGHYGPYPPKTIAHYEVGVLAPGSDPAEGTIRDKEVKNITYLYTEKPGTVYVHYLDAITRAPLIPTETYVVPAGNYGPFGPKEIFRFSKWRLAPESDPPSGTIRGDEVKNIIYLYTEDDATVIVKYLDATTLEPLLPQESHQVEAGHYGPYPPKPVDHYLPGVLAPGSDPAEGTIRGTEIKTVTYWYSEDEATVIVKYLDAVTLDPLLPNESYQVGAGHYGPYPPKPVDHYETGVLASGSDPAEGTIRGGEVKTITYLYSESSATVIVKYLDAVTGNSLIPDETYTVPAGNYGPYPPKPIDHYLPGVLAPGSDPAQGTIRGGEVKTVTYRYSEDEATVIVRYLDAADNTPLLAEETHQVPAGLYGPYPPQDIRFYRPGVLASGSDPAEGTIRGGEVKTVTYLYTRGTASVVVIHLDLANGNMIGNDNYTIPAGEYGPYGPKVFDGYGVGEIISSSHPISGEVDVGQMITIYYGYQRATVTVNIIHRTPTNILWTETFTLPVGDYGPFYPFVFPGYKPGQWDPSSADPSGRAEEVGTVIDIVFIYEPL